MSFRYGVLGSGNSCTVLISLLRVELAVYIVGDRVAVECQRRIEDKVLSRHGLGYIPAGEGVSFRYGVLGSGYGCAVLIGLLCVELTVYIVGDRVAVGCQRCIEDKVISRHGLGYIPAGEGVSFRYGVLGSGNSCAVLIGLLRVELAVYVVGNGVAVECQRCIEDKVLSRHGLRHIPAGEGISLRYGVLGSGNSCAVLISLLRVELAVYVVGNGVSRHIWFDNSYSTV